MSDSVMLTKAKAFAIRIVTFKCHTITLDTTTKPHYTNTINSRYHKISAFFAVKLSKGTGLFSFSLRVLRWLLRPPPSTA